jgi:hypothetical protein
MLFRLVVQYWMHQLALMYDENKGNLDYARFQRLLTTTFKDICELDNLADSEFIDNLFTWFEEEKHTNAVWAETDQDILRAEIPEFEATLDFLGPVFFSSAVEEQVSISCLMHDQMVRGDENWPTKVRLCQQYFWKDGSRSEICLEPQAENGLIAPGVAFTSNAGLNTIFATNIFLGGVLGLKRDACANVAVKKVSEVLAFVYSKLTDARLVPEDKKEWSNLLHSITGSYDAYQGLEVPVVAEFNPLEWLDESAGGSQ